MSGSAAVDGWADAIRSFGDGWPTVGAQACADAITQVALLDTGGDSRLSNHVGGTIGVSVDARAGEATVMADGARGVWAILEWGTQAHEIRPRNGRYLMTPYGPRRMVQVEGVAARHTWTTGAAAGMTEAERSADEAWGEVDS